MVELLQDIVFDQRRSTFQAGFCPPLKPSGKPSTKVESFVSKVPTRFTVTSPTELAISGCSRKTMESRPMFCFERYSKQGIISEVPASIHLTQLS